MKKFAVIACWALAAVGCGDAGAPSSSAKPSAVAENAAAPTTGSSANADVMLVTLSVPEMT